MGRVMVLVGGGGALFYCAKLKMGFWFTWVWDWDWEYVIGIRA